LPEPVTVLRAQWGHGYPEMHHQSSFKRVMSDEGEVLCLDVGVDAIQKATHD
jgi:hypothetical protein